MGKLLYDKDATTLEVQGGYQRHPCGCMTNPPGAREGLRLFVACDTIAASHARYRELTPRLFADAATKQEAEQAWAACAEHIKDSRGGKIKGKTGKGKAVERTWGSGAG